MLCYQGMLHKGTLHWHEMYYVLTILHVNWEGHEV